ncbi:MAG: hypothetical protein JO197_16955 [Acidobacteria bacterium]|nr:hypothetical protein [Acidobacteriota bacterium]MBV9478487.1 hypothetical protein [Acidobacteriota bacterium]
MADEVKNRLRNWGIDVDRFEERAKESLQNARGDLSEITGTLRHTLIEAKDVLVGLHANGAPVAAELKSGFERAWQEIERAFSSARQKAKDAVHSDDAPPLDETTGETNNNDER